jgi:hypothetical protein
MLLRAALSAIPRPRPATLPAGTSAAVFAVDLEHLLWYEQVCGFRKDGLLPVTYPHVLAFGLALGLMSRSDFPFPVIGLVHIANRIEQRRRLTAADRLAIRVGAADLREHPRGRQFDLVTTAECDGEPVWSEVSTYLRREKTPPNNEGDQPPSPQPRTAVGDEASGKLNNEGDQPPSPQSRTGVGDEASGRTAEPPVPQVIWRVGGEVGRAYARVSGDRNPIHTSRVGARLFGFPRPIAHGMWTKARCLAALEGRLPEAFTVDVAFKLPIPLPSKAGFTYAGGDLSVFNARNGKPHLSGRIAA